VEDFHTGLIGERKKDSRETIPAHATPLVATLAAASGRMKRLHRGKVVPTRDRQQAWGVAALRDAAFCVMVLPGKLALRQVTT